MIFKEFINQETLMKRNRQQSMLKLGNNITMWIVLNIDGLIVLHLDCPTFNKEIGIYTSNRYFIDDRPGFPDVYKHLNIMPGGDPKRVIVSVQETDIYKTKKKGLIIDAFTDLEQLNAIYPKAECGQNTIFQQIAGYIHRCRFRLQLILTHIYKR